MSATYLSDSTRTVATTEFRSSRIAGFAGLFFALFVGMVNVLVGSMAPPAFDASANDISAFIADNKAMLTVASGATPLGVIALFFFLSGVFPVLSARSNESAFWARLGVAGLIVIEIMFMTRMLFEVVLIANADSLNAEPLLLETLWQFQNSAMTFNGLAIALAIFGLSRAAQLSGLIPAWHAMLGYASALGFLVAAMGAVSALEGSVLGIVGLPAFLAWLVWLALISVRLLRTDRATA